MKASKLLPPYYRHPYFNIDKTTFGERDKAGVYLIYKNGVLCYIGYSGTDLYKTMYRHFQSWKDNTQIRVTYNPAKVKVRVVYTNTPAQAEKLEKALILKLKPKDNPNKYLEYEAEPDEIKIYKEYLDVKSNPVKQFEGEVPF